MNSEINNIEWTADGKIKLIDKPGTTILFYYDAQGNRTCKVDATNKVEYYLRDANGQLLEILEFDITNPNGGGGFPVEWCTIRTIVGTHGVQQNKGKKDDGKKDKQAENKLQSSDPLSWDFEPTDLLSLNEPTAINPFLSTINTDVDNLDFTSNQWFVYGSESHGRFVTIRSDANHGGYNTGLLSNDIMEEARYLNTKFYELKDHLGNVRVVLRDWKLNPNNDGLPPFNAQPVEVFNYYAYGMMIPSFFSNTTPDYRFGFNGMLRDDDVRDEKLTNDNEGMGNSYDFGARILDPRVGRWLSLDPLMSKYPFLSPYVYAGSNPVFFIDKDGKDYSIFIDHNSQKKSIIIKATVYTVANNGNFKPFTEAENAAAYWHGQNGKFIYEVQNGENKIAYDIIFKLDVKVVHSPENQYYIDQTPDKMLMKGEKKLTTDNLSNSLMVLNSSEDKFKISEPGIQVVQGLTISGALIYINSDFQGTLTSSHEFGHILGIALHNDQGLMTPYSNSTNSSDQIFPEDIQTIIDHAINHGANLREGISKTKIKELGDHPAQFNNGKVMQINNKAD